MVSPITKWLLLQLIVSISVIVIISISKFPADKLLASSPSFGYQEELDNLHDVFDINCVKMQISKHVDKSVCGGMNETNTNRPVDILRIDYLSDGKTLNGTLWFPPKDNVSSNTNDEVNYGILIDADSNINTGLYGIDYQLEVSHKNGKWEKTFNQTSMLGSRILDGPKNFTGFQGVQNVNYVPLYVDLNSMGSPDKSRVMFYTEDRSKDNSKQDFSGWIDIPQPSYKLLTTPSTIVLRQGQNESYFIQLSSNGGIVPGDSYNLTTTSMNPIESKFISNGQRGLGPASLSIKIPENASPATYPIAVVANKTEKSTLPYLEVVNLAHKFIPLNLTVNVLPKVGTLELISEQLRDFNSKWVQPLSGTYTFIAGLFAGGISRWIYSKINKKERTTKK